MNKMNFTVAQWQVIKEIVDINERKRKYCLKSVFRAIFYLLKTGCQWRMLPDYYPRWEIVYYYFSLWRDANLIEEILHTFREKARVKKGKKAGASAGVIDSQSVRSGCNNAMKGFDGNKKVKGRERHIVVDTNGWLIATLVHCANIHDSQATSLLLRRLKESVCGIKLIFADGGYRGELIEKVKATLGYIIQIIPKAAQGGFSPRRWVVERTFAWFGYQRKVIIRL
jgi:putative transposase